MGRRWRGYEHPELYTMINGGPGAAASEPQTAYWEGLHAELTTLDEDLNKELGKLGARWEGQAAESAQSGLTPLAAWASDAQTGASVMKASTVDQAQFVSDARASMPEPVEVTTPAPSGWDIAKAAAAAGFGFTGPAQDVAQQADDHEAQEAAKNEAEQRAVETMQTYESNSTWNSDTLGTFVPPPDVVVSTPAPQGGTASAVLLSNTNVKNVGENGTGDTDGVKNSQVPGGSHVNTVDPPTGNVDDPGSTGGGGGGGGVHTPPTTTNPPATTNPSDVFVPSPPPPSPLPPTPNPLPPNPTVGSGPFLPGGGPVPTFGGDPSPNAGDIARRAVPLRTGAPGEGPFGGRGTGGPGSGGVGAVDGERMPSQLGRGGAIGEGVVRNGPGAAGAAGRGGNGVNGPGGAGRRGEGEEDDEHYSPDYLLETDDVFGDDTRVAPTVIGE
jgi:PPE family